MATDPVPTGVLPGPIRQVAHVVADLDDAIAGWLRVGVGPWFVLGPMEVPSIHRGEQISPRIVMAFACSGSLQVELVAQLDDTPTIYRERYGPGEGGLHHHAWWTPDVDGAVLRAEAAGWQVVTDGSSGGMARFCYLEHPEAPTFVELMELNEMTGPFMEAIEAAAVDWDGTDPIR